MTNTHEATVADFQELKAKVLEKKPILAEILREQGNKNLFSYALEYIDVNINPPIKKRQDELISTFTKYLHPLLGETVTNEAARQLEKYYFVSTADHHGPICHPFFINSNMLAAAAFGEYPDPVLKYIIVFACASVSFNNSSFPRGLIFHSAVGDNKMQQIGLLPDSSRHYPVLSYRAYAKTDIDRAKTIVSNKLEKKEILDQEAAVINNVLDEIYMDEGALNSQKFSDQVTKTNYALWKKIFHNNANVPDLIYLDLENMVARLIIDHHLNADTNIKKIIIDPLYGDLVMNYFDGIAGGFSQKDKYGTFLFWALPKGKGYRVQLWKQGNELVSDDGSFRLPLDPESIGRALAEQEIFPSVLLIFMVLSFYYGLKCLGGFSSVNYATFMKNAYIKMMAELGDYKSIEVCARAQTKELCGEITLAFLQSLDKKLVPATGLDLIINGNQNTWPHLVELTKTITLEEALNQMIPEFYKIIYPENQRNPRLEKITPDDIARITGLDKKMKACIQLT